MSVLVSLPLRRAVSIIVSAFVFVAFAAVSSFASVTGSITGRLVDTSGAVVPNASITLVSVETASRFSATTNSDGEYHFLALPVGHYTLQASATGFASFEEKNIAIDANDALRIDIRLRVAAGAETVQVEANSLHIETTSNQIGNVIGSSTLLALPLDGRSYTDLLGLQAGVAPASAGTVSIGFIPGLNVGAQEVGNLSINGARESDNGFIVNGGRVEDPFTNGTSVIPNLDSIQEFRLLTSNFDAEYGYFGGGIVNVVTKAGTNDLHGDVFFFARNQNLDANNFFSTNRGQFTQYQPGSTLGGPIKRDKLFFFADYQGTFANIGAATGLVAVPTTAQRNGQFDPSTLTGSVNGGYWANILSQRLGTVVTPGESYTTLFPNGVIPQTAWSAPSKIILPLYPDPNAQGFYSGIDATTNKDNRGGIRGDYIGQQLGTVSAYYFIDRIITTNAFGGNEVPGWPAGTVGRNQQANVGDSKTFGSNAINELRLNYSRYVDIYAAPQGTSKNAADYGINGYAITGEQGLPHISVTGLSGLIGLPAATFYTTANTYEVLEGFSKVIGSHNTKFGGEFGWSQWDSQYVPSGGFSFTGNETGNAVADFLLGAPVLVRQPSPEYDIANTRFGGVYAQDSWHARPKVTLNYGLRWQVALPWYEQNNRFATVVPGQQSTIFPTAPLGLVYPGDAGIPRGIAPTRWKDFAPRVGFAYTPTTRLSVRAAYGIFFTADDTFSSFFAGSPPPYQIFYVSPSPNLLDYPYTDRATGVVNHPYPFNYPTKGDTNINFSQFLPLGGYPFTSKNNVSPYTQVYSLSLQQELTRNNVLSINYAGSVGRHLLTNEELNPGSPSLCLSLSQTSDVAPGTQTCGPSGEDSTYTRSNGAVVKSTRPFLGAQGFSSTPVIRSIGTSNYNSLQVSLNHVSKIATFLAAYTWSKSLDDSSSISDQGINPFNPQFSYGLSSFDVAHNVVVSYNIHPPFADLAHGHWSRVTGGWELTGITRLSTGFPVLLSESDDRSLLGVDGVINGGFDVPNYTPGNLNLGQRPPSTQPYFNTGLFSQDVLGQLGNSNRRFFHGPGIINFDTALVKNTRITEGISTQFRAEFFNVFNHPQFGSPGGNISSASTFGVITSAGDPRIGQLALKVIF